jgi:hypothetical protein
VSCARSASWPRSIWRCPAGVTNGRRDGDEEVAGFLFTAETLAALAELDLGKLSLGPARVVLIARDDLAGGEGRLAEALRDIGTAVELVEEPGFAAMNQDPHKSVPPAALWRRIVDGAVARSGGRAASPPTPTPNSPATMRAASGGVRERFVRLGPARAAAVITAGASGGAAGAPALVWLNAGAVARLGPSRLHVTLARRWARRGVTSVRVDLPGFGDTDATAGGGEHPLYDRGVVDQVLAIADAVHAELGGPVVLAGLCAGAYAAFWSAARAAEQRGARPPIAGALLSSTRRPSTFGPATRSTSARARRSGRPAITRSGWARPTRGGDCCAATCRSSAWWTPSPGGPATWPRRAPRRWRCASAAALPRRSSWCVRCARSTRPASRPSSCSPGDDPGLDNLEGLLGKRLALVGDRVADHVGWQVIDGPDHTFTPLWAQAQLSAALEQLLLPRFWRGSAP